MIPRAINEFHELTKKRPQNFCKKIHRQVYFVEKLLLKKGIEYKPIDPELFEEYCKTLKHQKGIWAGKPFVLSIEQRWIVHCVLGIKIFDKSYKMWLRFYKEVVVFVGRKWGKSLFLAALATYCAALDKEPGAEVICYASSGDQAQKVFAPIENFIKDSPELKSIFKPRTILGKKHYFVKGTNSYITYGTGTPKGKMGNNPHLAIFDEAHEIIKLDLYTSQTSGQGARTQALAFTISTAGIIRNSLYDKHLETIEVLCKKPATDENARLFFAVFEIDVEDNPSNEKIWIKANPGMNENRPPIAFLRKEYTNAVIDITKMPTFLAVNLNRPSNNALTYIELDELKNARLDIIHEMYYDSYAFGGVDLSDTTDLTCATALIPIDPYCEKFIFLQRYFVAESFIDKNSEKDKIIYRNFTATLAKCDACLQLLEIVPGNFIDKQYVARWFQDLETKYKITFLKIGYDRALKNEYLKYALETFDQEIVTRDINGVEVRDNGVMTDVAQGWITTSTPIKNIKKYFELNLIYYDSTNMMFEFCVNNLKVNVDRNGNCTVDKQKSTGRIDGFASLIDAIVAMERGKNIYLGINKTHNIYQNG